MQTLTKKKTVVETPEVVVNRDVRNQSMIELKKTQSIN